MLSVACRGSTARAPALAAALTYACELEIRALKPGNVGLHGDGHGMTTADFLASADAIAVPLTEPVRSVGERILAAIQATRRVAACNTNLGIVLLCAPLVQAALQCSNGGTVRAELSRTLARLDVRDAELAYEAIRLAQPGGLGKAARHDVSEKPCVSLLAAMREAAPRDSIARQYANGFADVLDHGVPRFRELSASWGRPEWAAAAVFLDFLACLPDSHIVRKLGRSVARLVSREAAELGAKLGRTENPEQFSEQLLEWDQRLKRQGINPGTSADLTVAAVLAAQMEHLIDMSCDVGPCPQPVKQLTQKEETPWQKSVGCV